MQTAEQLRLRPFSCSIYFTFTVNNTVIALQNWADFMVDSLNRVLTLLLTEIPRLFQDSQKIFPGSSLSLTILQYNNIQSVTYCTEFYIRSTECQIF